MSLKEHEGNRFTEEKNEVEKYLLRIIQRYFDIENNFTKESIEAIIIESLTRLKQSIIAEKGFLFSLNNQTGNIVLTIKDFNGELAFNKNTAFNKDFGSEADTICEGNDERLCDDREPLEHVHEIANIKGLKEELEKVGVPTGLHTHKNKTILDALIYTGAQTQIDLIVIEYLQKSIDDYYSNLQQYQRELKSLHEKNTEDFDIYIPQLEQILQDAEGLINDAITWLQNAYDYTDSQVSSYKTNAIRKLLKYISKEQAQKFIDFFKKPYYIVSNGEIPITDGDISLVPIEDDFIDTYQESYGHTNIAESKTIQYTITDSAEVTNLKIKLFFRYDKDGKTITTPLPFNFKNENGNSTIIQGAYTKDGDMMITSNYISQIQLYASDNNLYDSETIIVASHAIPATYNQQKTLLKEQGCNIALIDSESKNAFVKSLLLEDKEYYIQGYNVSILGEDYMADDETVLTYTDWDTDEPNPTGLSSNIKFNTNKKWAAVDGITAKLGYIAEYKIQRLTQYFDNPRIYYQVLGNKEVI